jgi:hypothetical protein
MKRISTHLVTLKRRCRYFMFVGVIDDLGVP